MRKVPELRFKEFSGEWEEKSYNEIFKINQGLQIPISERFTSNKEGRYFYITNEFLKKDTQLSYYIENPPESVICEKCDILMTRTGNTGKVVTDVAGAFHNNFFKIKYNTTTMNKQFIYYILTSIRVQRKIISLAGNSTIPDLNHSDFYKISSGFPTLQEQQKIADFLSLVDNKISLTEEKLENLKNYKKGIMQKIFSQEIRFKDENGEDYPEWGKRILKEIIVKNKEKNKANKYSNVQTVSNKYGFINQKEYFENRKIASENLKNYYVINKKNFAYNPSRIDVGSLAYKDDCEISVISPLYVSFYSNENYVVDSFLLNWFYSNLFLKQMSNSFEGSVRNTLSYDALSSFKILLPSLLEQQKIANFLSLIDNKISITANILKELKTYKKGLLQKMFI